MRGRDVHTLVATRHRFVVVAIATIMLAGCSGPGDHAGAGDPDYDSREGEKTPDSGAPIWLHLQTANWTWDVGVGGPGIGFGGPGGGSPRGFFFDVPENATAVRASVDWTCASGELCDLILMLWDSDGDVVTTEGPSPLTIERDSGGGEADWELVVGASSEGSIVLAATGSTTVLVEMPSSEP